MKQKAKQFLAMFLAVIMVVLLVPVTSGHSTAYAETTIDSVRAAIKELSADPTEFSAADKARVEAINADFESLSAEDQATLDSEGGHPSDTGQSLGRVLESALWSVRSYETDTSTTLGNGEYTTTTKPAVSSVSSKGKSDSSRTRNWWVEKVVVENGQATAYIYVTSGAATASKLTSYPSVWSGGQTITRDTNNNYAIPVDINGITYFGGISSSMPTPIMYALETTIDESVPTADYSAVDAALAKVPADLSIYTDETAAAVTAAVNAVVRDKPASEQAEVDAMAQAIEDAIAALVEKPSVERIDLAITNNIGMFKAATAYLETKDGKTNLVMALNGTGYKELYKGTYEDAVKNGDGSAENGNNTWIHSYTNAAGKLEFVIPIEDGVSYYPVVAVSNSYYNNYLSGTNPIERAFYPRQFTLDREKKTLVLDEYNETSDFAVTSNVADFKVAEKASTEVVGGPNSNNYSVAPTLVMSNRTYDKVTFPTVVSGSVGTGTADLEDGKFVITMTNAPNKEAFKDKTPIEMTFHVSSDAPYEEAGTDVVRTLTIDKMAKTIVISGTALTPTDDAKDLKVTNNVKMLKVNGATLDNDNLVLQMGSDAYNYVSVGDIATAEKDAAPIALVDGNTFTIPASTIDKTGKEFYVSLKSKKNGTWYERIFTLNETAETLTIDPSDADYTAVNAAIASIPEDLSIYTEESVKAVNDAKDAVVEKLFKSQQAEVDAMAQAIEDAVAALQKKDSGDDPAETEKTSLYPINDEAMFKVVNAFLETKDGKTELVFALSAKGYKDVIPATYEEALAMGNKDAWSSYKEAEVDCKYTARGTETDEGVQNKYQFRVPVKVNETGKTMIPMISVSARERDNAENAAGTGKPDYSKAFMARRFIIDMDSKELHTGNYQEEMPITVTSEIETFKVEKEGVVSILGCPPANEYEAKPTITLSDQVYDKAFIGKAENVDEEKAVEVGKDGKIKLDFINSRSRGISLIDGTNPITVAFHVKETGEWIDREFVMDLANKKITITGEEIKTKDEIKETPANYNKVNEAKKEAEKIDNDLFTEDSIRELSEALSAVEENLTADKQQEVNEMANGINKAMKGLKLKDGVYTIPANSLGNDFMDVVIEVEGGKMSAYVITTSRAQDKIFQGTKEEAENSGEATEKLAGVKNSLGMPGASMFKIPLDALNDTLEFAIHSPDGWTDRKIVIKATDIKKGEYKIIENTDGEFTLGEELTLSSDADFSKFVAVIVDDEVVEPTNYDVVSGSTKVTFKKSYTETLGESSHEVQILSYDGIAKTVIKGVNKQTEPTEPETKPGKEENIKPGNDSGADKSGTKTPGGSKTNQTKNNTNSTTKRGTEAAKTGDETNAFVYLTIFIAAAISTLLVYRRKQR